MSPKKVFPNARKLGIEVHKFGGASLADAAAFRHAVEIVKTRNAAARRRRVGARGRDRRAAGAGDAGRGRRRRERREGGRRAARPLPASILRGAAARGDARRSRGEIDALDGRARAPALQPGGAQGADRRARATSSSAAASGCRRASWPRRSRPAACAARYVDATEVVFTDGPFGGASPNLMLTDLARAQGAAPALRGGDHPGRPGVHRRGQRRRAGRRPRAPPTRTATTGARRRRHAGPRRHRSDRHAARARAVGAARSRSGRTFPGCSPPTRAWCPTRASSRSCTCARRPSWPTSAPRCCTRARSSRSPGAPSRSSSARSPTPPAPGTEISARRTLDRYPVKALSAVGGQALVTVAGQRHAGRARDRGAHLRGAAPRGDQRLAHLAVVVGAVDLLLGARGRRRGARATA